ncbi:hypothetical protein [Pontibacter akesuensis]|uniref:Phosphatidate cytidylyltransferase n=1 Tax=Pontibacter akesuensis TaxID=388950 RepID=A0A1I7FKE4_9BACT|nr:hypothetical protein [Pontibacter akesuensis]GHA61761.1 hypothetical protein GCM10007389_12900 [Pontibacter akesuensis]SFU36618.1 hypothetical protein SAMN04487941_0270 [Pontibacter akesuensis]
MKKLSLNGLYSLLFLLFTLTLGGCDFVGDVFELGMWTALVIIVILVLLVYFVAKKFRGR